MRSISSKAVVLLLSIFVLSGCGDDGTVEPDCTVGASCNDGNAQTINDVYDADCVCAGTAVCTPGASCDDGDNTTLNDVYDANCDCAGTPTACTGIGDADGDGVCSDVDCDDSDDQVTSQPGDSCDDGDANTIDDELDGDCSCTGTCTVEGDPCDDLNANTYNDIYNAECECEGTEYGSFTDPRDGQTYLTVEIGSQKWMAENLNYDAGVNWCFANTAANCDVYGRLYDWETATQACPTGWHLPDDAEWDELINFLGGQNVAGGKMKEAGTVHWSEPNTGATNSSGFTGLPGGYRLIGTGMFGSLGTNATWWSASVDMALAAWHRNILFGGESVTRGSSLRGDGFSVRCLED